MLGENGKIGGQVSEVGELTGPGESPLTERGEITKNCESQGWVAG